MMKIWLGLLALLLITITAYMTWVREPALQKLAGPELSSYDDPYLWLEEVEGEKALDWVRLQNERAMAELQQDSRFESFKQQTFEIIADQARLPSVAIRGEYVYNLWRDEDHKRGLWRRMSWRDFMAQSEDWEVIINLDQLAEQEGKSWVWQGSTCLRPDYNSCLLRLSNGGKDAGYIREFDMEQKRFVEDGFNIPEAKGMATWLDKDKILVSTALFEGSETESGYSRTVRLWERGQSLEKAPIVFEGDFEDISVGAMTLYDGDLQHVLFRRSTTFYTQKLFYYNGETIEVLDLPDHIRLSAILKGQLIFRLRQDDLGFQKGDVLAVKLSDLLESHDLEPELVFRPSETQAVTRIHQSGDRLLVFYLDKVRGRAALLSPPTAESSDGEGLWTRKQVDVAEQGTISLMSADEDSERVLIRYEDFLTPPSMLGLDNESLRLQSFRQEPARFESEGFKVEQHFAVSSDGVEVPYYLVYHPEKIGKDPAPTLLDGYGGFEISRTPNYSAIMGKLWLENGGVYVLANIRGGGEYGPAWHQAAQKLNRQKSFDDFIAVAEDLIARKVTSPERLGIRGGSNGGLLVAVAFTQRPDLFNAVICKVPLLDMLRYHRLLAGASWVGEYGNPDQPEYAEFLRSYSPYHNVKGGVRYPPIFFITSTKDDRVHPGHARKMAAKMLEQGHPIYYLENIEGGHSASADLVQMAERLALEYVYLWRNLQVPLSH